MKKNEKISDIENINNYMNGEEYEEIDIIKNNKKFLKESEEEYKRKDRELNSDLTEEEYETKQSNDILDRTFTLSLPLVKDMLSKTDYEKVIEGYDLDTNEGKQYIIDLSKSIWDEYEKNHNKEYPVGDNLNYGLHRLMETDTLEDDLEDEDIREFYEKELELMIKTNKNFYKQQLKMVKKNLKKKGKSLDLTEEEFKKEVIDYLIIKETFDDKYYSL
jgi:hypothetical protein